MSIFTTLNKHDSMIVFQSFMPSFLLTSCILNVLSWFFQTCNFCFCIPPLYNARCKLWLLCTMFYCYCRKKLYYSMNFSNFVRHILCKLLNVVAELYSIHCTFVNVITGDCRCYWCSAVDPKGSGEGGGGVTLKAI